MKPSVKTILDRWLLCCWADHMEKLPEVFRGYIYYAMDQYAQEYHRSKSSLAMFFWGVLTGICAMVLIFFLA